MLTLAGQYSDGVLFNYPCTPSFIEYAMPFIEDGLRRSGRSEENFAVAAYLLVAVDEDEKKALDSAKRFLAQKLPTRHSQMLRQAGVSAEKIALVKDNVERFGLEKAASELSDSLVRKVTIAGTPDQVVEGALDCFLALGLTLPIVWEIIGSEIAGIHSALSLQR